MALNLNSSPYYDDFDGTKNYNRVLFKPGVAVQARELTQLQTALSDQLSQLGSFTLKEGAIISGCEEKISSIPYIKITDSDFDGAPIANSSLVNYVGATLVGGTSGLKARVLTTKTGNTSESPDTKTLYISYTDQGTNTAGELEFTMGETLTVDSDDSTINGDTFVVFNSATAEVGTRERYAGVAPFLTLSPGIVYALGTFIRTEEITVFVDNYTPLADKKVGFLVTQKIIQSSDDNTLLDPASGSFNYNAPGADRLQHEVTLASYKNSESVPENFFQYASWEFGKIVRTKIKSDPLGQLSTVLAGRSYDTNGNYTVQGLQCYFREHLDDRKNGGLLAAQQGGESTKLVAAIRPGRASVAGYPVELLAEKLIPFDKPSATRIEETVTQSTAFGNYIIIDDVCGVWDVDGGGTAGNGIIDLYDTAQDAVTDTTFSATSISGNKVGSAKTRHLELHSGTPGTAAAQYKLYLYDIRMSTGDFKDVRSAVYENTESNALADVVLNTAGNAQVYETNFNKLIWNLPYSHIKTLQADSGSYDYNFKFIREFDLTADLSGNINVASAITNQTFFFGNGLVSDSLIEANIQLLATDSFTLDGTPITAGEYIDLSGKVTQVDESNLTINLGSAIVGSNSGVRIYVNMQISDTSPLSKTLLKDRLVKIDATTNENSASGKFSLGIADVFKVKQILATDNSDYETGARNVTNEFIFNNGQKDNFYGLGTIQQKSSSSVDLSTYRYITVKLDYFSRTVAGPSFACVDSYPVDDSGLSGIKTEEIPVFFSVTGNIYDLKNAIDFRPYVVNTAADSTTLAGATENPSIFEETDRPSNGLTNPVPAQEFTTDLEYYLAEAYRVVITAEGKFKVVKSNPDIFPKLPAAPEKSMTLASGYLPPYPCLASRAAKYYGRQDLAVSVKLEKNKRYTMRDIGALEERISNLEYYTALTLLEKQAGEVKILDTDGVDRFKNGYMVDSFTGFGVNYVSHQDNNCSIDKKKRQLRAAFDSTIIGFKPTATGTTVGQTGDMFHVPYFESVYAKQLQASKFRNVIGELLIKNPTTPPVTVAPPPPVAPGQPAFYLVRSKASVKEGTSFIIYLETDNVARSAIVPYTITGVSSADISSASLTGNFTIDSSGDALLTVNVSNVAGNKSFTLTLDGKGISTSVTINDTSTAAVTPVAPGPYFGTLSLSPDEDTFYDIHSAPEPYKNDNGEWDNLSVGSLPTADGITSGWSIEWGSWEYATETIGAAYPGDNFGVEFDGQTTAVDNGLYVPSYGVTWTNEGAIPAKSTTVWEIRSGSYVWNGPETQSVEREIIIDADTFIRPVSITGSVEGLLPNATHVVVMDGVRKGDFTSNANGRGTFTINVNSGEFRTGNLVVQVSNTESITNATSFAQAYFTANHTKNALVTREITTKWPMPSTPIVPEVRSTTILDTATTVENTVTDKSTIYTETATKTTEVITSNGVIIATNVPIEELNMQDFEVSSSCDGSRSKAIMQRPDGTQYGVEIDDPGCFVHSDYIASKNTPVLAEPDTTYNTVTKTTTTQQAAVNETIIADIDGFIDDNTGGVHTTTVTKYNDELATTVFQNTASDYNLKTNISLTTGNQTGAAASEDNVAVVVGPYTDTANDASVDPLLATIAAEAFQFDFSEFDLFCAEAGIYGGAFDPLAQTFFVEDMPGGMFITSADIFFRSISSEENNNGITLQIREVVNGVPGTTIVPNGQVHMRRSACYTSTINVDGSVEYASTNFKFKNPVHLNNNTEYCMVLVPDANDPGYEVWIGELGGTEVGTTTRITKQAHSGVLFTSANNRSWSAHQSEDLMFVLRRAKFDVNKDFILNTTNKNTDWIKVDHSTWNDTVTGGLIPTPKFDRGDVIHGFTFLISNGGSGYASAPTVSINNGGGSGATATATLTGGVVTSVTITNFGTGYTENPTISLSGGTPTTEAVISARLNRAIHKFFDRGYSTYEFEVTNGYFTVGDRVSNSTTDVEIAEINDRAVSAHVIQASSINPDDRGTITPQIALTASTATSANNTYSNVTLQDTVELSEEKTIYSYSNEHRDFLGNKTAKLQFTLRTASNNVAPMIDLSSLDMLALVNDINYPTVAEEVTTGGNANSKYISRQVILAEGQDAEDFKVYLDNIIPTGTAVEVYAKLQNAEDDAEFLNEITWKKLEVDDQPFVATQGLAEYSYKIPAKSSGWGLNGSDIFEYDVTRISDIAITSGGSGYSSAPTVTITDTIALTGTVTATTSSASVTGVGTAFETELEVGSILLDSTGSVAGTVSSILSDTSLTLTTNSLVNITSGSAKKQGNGYGATAEAVLSGDVVTAIRIINPGRDYTGTVTATVTGGSPSVAAVLGTVTTATVTYTGFKYFAVKIVHLSSNTAVIPKSSGLRAYALQA